MAGENRQGLLMIPDISGFTEFVSEVEISHSEHIIAELLELLITEQRIGLELCEIEGDALFFYRVGDPPTLAEVIDQAEAWVRSFHTRLNLIKRDVYCGCGVCQNVGELGLKVVVHFGEFGLYTVQSKTKIIGKDVILVHRLLKNQVPLRNYVLVTDGLLSRQPGEAASRLTMMQEEVEVFGNIALGCLDFEAVLAELPSVPPCEPIPELQATIGEEIVIQAPFSAVVARLADLASWPDWVEGLDRIQMDKSRPLRDGHHHVCVFPDQHLSITVNQIIRDETEFAMVHTIKPPPMLRKLIVYHTAEATAEGTRVQHRFTYDRKPLFGRRFDRKVAPQLVALAGASMANLKRLLESPAAQSG